MQLGTFVEYEPRQSKQNINNSYIILIQTTVQNFASKMTTKVAYVRFFLLCSLRSFVIVQVYWDELYFQSTISFFSYVRQVFGSDEVKCHHD